MPVFLCPIQFCFVFFAGTSLYIHNCSSDPHTCQRYGITGYPTLTAFRSLSWSAVHKCSSSKSTYLRLDYHGPVTVSVVIFTLELLRTNNVLLESLLQKLLHNFVNFCSVCLECGMFSDSNNAA